MNAKYTPGPWEFYREGTLDRGDKYGVRAPAPDYWAVPPLNINPYDARLIAAAPELLEALHELVEEFDWHDSRTDKARAVIAKATGEQ